MLICFVPFFSQGRDLSPVTDELWRKFYDRKWGKDELEEAQLKPQAKRKYPWRRLYQVIVLILIDTGDWNAS